MKDRTERRGLGRGLSALLADAPPAAQEGEAPSATSADTLPIDRIRANPDQPRKHFDKDDLEELATSIRANGILQPLVVRKEPGGDGTYQIVVGERRWRAAQLAQLHEVPAIVKDIDDATVMELAIIENIQRADLNPIEEAAGYRQLMDKFGHTQERLAEALGKSRSHIANLLRLLNLPPEVADMVVKGSLSAGHARILVPLDNATELARQIVSKGLSVRDAEKLAKEKSNPAPAAPKKPKIEKDADTRAVEAEMTASLGMKVAITPRQDGEGGDLKISYKSLDQLDQLLGALSH